MRYGIDPGAGALSYMLTFCFGALFAWSVAAGDKPIGAGGITLYLCSLAVIGIIGVNAERFWFRRKK